MPLDLSGFVGKEQEFEGLDKAANSLRMRQYQQARLAMQEQGRQAATSKYLENQLSNKNYLTGTDYDPMITSKLQDVMTQAQQLASKGANLGDINMAIGPQLQDLNEYHAKATLLQKNINDYTERMKGVAGIDPVMLADTAKKMAFHNYDDKNQTWGELKPIEQVDPSTNYVEQALQQHPELMSNEGGLQKALTGMKQDVMNPRDNTTFQGRSAQVGYDAKMYPFQQLSPNKDIHGNPMGIETQYEIAHDGGKPITDETGQPMKVVPDGVYSRFVNMPGVKPFLDAQTKQIVNQLGIPMPKPFDPKYQLLQKHILYNYLDDNAPKTFSPIYNEKETAPAVRVELGQDQNLLNALNKYHQATSGTGDYYIPSQHGKTAGQNIKTNAVQAIGNVFNNNPDFTQGEPQDVNVGGEKRSLLDITPMLPGGGLKTGRGSDDVFKSVYYDPAKRSLIVEQESKEKDASTGQKTTSFHEVPESKAGLFLTRIASSNGVDPTKVPAMLNKMGYQNARFKNAADAKETINTINQAHQQKINDALDNDKLDDLKGLNTPNGTIQSINPRTFTFGGLIDQYSVDIKTPGGKTITQTFKDKNALSNFVKQSIPSKPVVTDKDVESTINKYLPK